LHVKYVKNRMQEELQLTIVNKAKKDLNTDNSIKIKKTSKN